MTLLVALALMLGGVVAGARAASVGLATSVAHAAPVAAEAADAGSRPAEAAAAVAEPVIAQLHASFSPDRLGSSTTISFGFKLRTSDRLAPPPLISMDLQMPAGMDYLHTTLGLATCTAATVIEKGAKGCPVNSVLGYGTAFVEVPFGKGAGKELPEIEAFMGPPVHEHMVVLFYANGQEPVYAQLAFSGEVLPDSGIFGSQLASEIPLVRSVTDGPDVSIVRVAATLGPNRVLYRKRVHGRIRRFHPRGIGVPTKCPKGGFPFAASFTFEDGSTAQATTTVPCPKARDRRRSGHAARRVWRRDRTRILHGGTSWHPRPRRECVRRAR